MTCPMLRFIHRLVTDEDGPTAVEYAVMLALIVGLCITSVGVMADSAADSFDDSAEQLLSVMGP